MRLAQATRLRERYPTEPWNLSSLARWLGLLGAITAGAGVLLLGARLQSWRTLLEGTLLGAFVTFLWLGRWLGGARGMTRTRTAVEVVAGFALQGLTLALALHYSTGSKNWPGLVGVDAALLAILAYAVGNRLVLVHALVNFFLFFGGETGYVSGWGMYWLGLTYPVRFFAVGAATLVVARLHGRLVRDAWRAFSRVYLHFGLLAMHLSLWFLAVFGYFTKHDIRWNDTQGERAAFSIAWAALSVGSVWLSGRIGLSTLRAYGVTFLVIDVYTFYFQFVVSRSAVLWWLHLLLVGGSLVLLAVRIERQRRGPAAEEKISEGARRTTEQ